MENKSLATFYDAVTGETIVRELTVEELSLIPQAPAVEANDDAEQPA